MMKLTKNILLLSITLASLASQGATNIYDEDYYEDEGRLLFKVRGYGIVASGKQKNLPTPTSANPVSVSPLIGNGYGADTATTIFFNDNMAAELSLGIDVLGIKSTALSNIANNYNGTTSTNSKRRNLFMVPLTLTAQYHIAPFGAIRPYVGAGYHGAYVFSRIKEFKANNSHGAVAQIGIDFVAKDDTLITLDVRQFLRTTKIKYKGSVTGGNSVSSKVKINPLVISAGIGFMF